MRRRPLLAATAILCAALAAAVTATGSEEAIAPERILPAVTAPLPAFQGTVYEAAARTALPPVGPEDHESLHNVIQLGEEIVSGSEPHGEEAFQIAPSMGIRTILSVDGKVPDAELAAEVRHALRARPDPVQGHHDRRGRADRQDLPRARGALLRALLPRQAPRPGGGRDRPPGARRDPARAGDRRDAPVLRHGRELRGAVRRPSRTLPSRPRRRPRPWRGTSRRPARSRASPGPWC